MSVNRILQMARGLGRGSPSTGRTDSRSPATEGGSGRRRSPTPPPVHGSARGSTVPATAEAGTSGEQSHHRQMPTGEPERRARVTLGESPRFVVPLIRFLFFSIQLTAKINNTYSCLNVSGR